METFTVRGGVPLVGTVPAGGSKNAALPLLFATLLTRGESVFENVPDIVDVHVTLAILSCYGAVIRRTAEHIYRIDTTALSDTVPPCALVERIRASTYLLGATLARFGRAYLLPFGGCAFSARPIDMHLGAIRTLGGTVSEGEVTATHLRGGHIVFPRISVGATVNALLLATAAEGESTLENVAAEPHVGALIDYLVAAGADITVADGRITVRGGRPLRGARARIIPDMIEAGTYLLCGPMTGGCVRVTGIDSQQLSALSEVLRAAGATVTEQGDAMCAEAPRPLSPMSVTAAPYPAFPTDLQPPVAALMAAHSGGEILDTVFPERYGYLSSLAALGVRSERHAPLLCIHPSTLHSGELTVPDLRGGAAALLCALRAEGESRLFGAELLLRGYGDLTGKLTALGARIEHRGTRNL